ncbi:MAG: PDZ domain-containing protein [Phycisphaerae bacterium]
MRRATTLVGALLGLLAAPIAHGAALPPSLAWLVPSRCRLFVEVRDLSGLYGRLEQVGFWSALDRASRLEKQSALDWPGRLEAALGMAWAEIVDRLFGQQVAIAAADPSRLEGLIVLARVPDRATVARLVGERRPVHGAPTGLIQSYQLGPMRLAVSGRLVLFGAEVGPARQLLEEAVQIVAGRAHTSLAASRSFLGELRRLPRDYDGLVWLDFGDAQAIRRPGGGRLWPFGRVRRLIAVWSVRQDGLDMHVSASQIASRPGQPGAQIAPGLLATLPSETLLAVGLLIDYQQQYRRALAGPAGSAIRGYAELAGMILGRDELERQLLARLGPQTLVVVGRTPAAQQQPAGQFDRPDLAVLVQTDQPEAVTRAVSRLAEGLVAVLNVQAGRGRQPAVLRLASGTHRGVAVRWVDLGPVLARRTRCPYLQQLQIAWAMLGNWLVVCSHVDQLRQIIDARSGSAPRLDQSPAYRPMQRWLAGQGVVVAQPAKIAQALRSWLSFCRRQYPQVFEPGWWARATARASGRRVSLGLAVRPASDLPGAVVVVQTLQGWPADGLLLPGDRIVAVDSRPLADERPLDDLRRLISQAPGPNVLLRVRRGQEVVDVAVPLPQPASAGPARQFDPVAAVRRLEALCGVFAGLDYLARQDVRGRVTARIAVRFEQNP